MDGNYKVGDKVRTNMGVGTITAIYECAGRTAMTVNHGPRNPACPTWKDEIIGKTASDARDYSR
jgi:hypothetical protein